MPLPDLTDEERAELVRLIREAIDGADDDAGLIGGGRSVAAALQGL